MSIGDIWDRLTPEQQKKAFFLFWGIVEFYASGDTWFATMILADPPAGLITGDFHYCNDLDRRAPGGRARIAFSWVLSMFGKVGGSPNQGGDDGVGSEDA